nr:uncharacterized protein CTRU02_15186 [Colletotrichum truncatum]KAF6781336.1 hypothetical protein CTRU02_15186 [Colletotrichum truncatum]
MSSHNESKLPETASSKPDLGKGIRFDEKSTEKQAQPPVGWPHAPRPLLLEPKVKLQGPPKNPNFPSIPGSSRAAQATKYVTTWVESKVILDPRDPGYFNPNTPYYNDPRFPPRRWNPNCAQPPRLGFGTLNQDIDRLVNDAKRFFSLNQGVLLAETTMDESTNF